ncbi:MAG: N-acetylglucosamine-6-phosphate deacetylase [Eubacteriales bacterium]
MSLLIKNTKVITPYEILENHSVLIKNGKIIDIYKDEVSKEDFSKVINAEGKYLAPGFIDVHNHGGFGHDVMESTFEALDVISRFHIRNGVTGFLATTMTTSTEATKKVIRNVVDYMKKEKQHGQSEILGLYLEGPYFSQEKKGAQPAEYIKNPDIDELKELLKISDYNVKVVALAPELLSAYQAIRYLKSEGVIVSLGHTNASYMDTIKAIQAGAIQATHLYNGMRDFSHREPGVVGAVLTDERVRCEMICDGIHIHKAAMALAVKMKGIDHIILISDAMMAAGLEDGQYQLGGQDVTVKNDEARLRDGTLAGSTLTLKKAVYNMVHLVGVPLKDAIRMATLNPAQALRIDAKKGSIEIGKDADMIIIDKDINIHAVIMKGDVIKGAL